MKKIILSLFTLTALSFSALGGQNEKFTGTTQIQAGTLTLKPGTTLTLSNTASAPQLDRAFYLGEPATSRTIVTATAITAAATTYTVANQPDVPRLLQTVRALTSTADTGVISVTIVGTDTTGAALTETILVATGATTTLGTKAFKTVTSVTQVGTNTAVDGADTVAVTCQGVYGLPVIPVATQTFAITTSGSTLAASAVVTNASVALCTVAVATNGGAKLWVHIAR